MKFFSEIIERDSFVIEYGSHVMDAIIIVLDGAFSFSIEGASYRAEKYSICVFPKNTLFERIVLEKIRCIYLQFPDFPVPLFSGMLKTSDKMRTENTIAHLAQAAAEKNGQLTEHFIWDILLLHHSPPIAPAGSDPLVASCIAHMSQHCGKHISLGELAERFFLSKQGFILHFRKATGKTPMEYLRLIRIDSAKLLLRDTVLSIGEIAQQCGFESIYYFSSRFKATTGFSPSEYRKRVRRSAFPSSDSDTSGFSQESQPS